MTPEFLIFNGLFRSLRYLVLFVLPMRRRFRVRGWRAIASLFFFLLLAVALSRLIMDLMPNNHYDRLISSCFGILYTFLFCKFMTVGSSLPALFIVLMEECYGDNVNLISGIVFQVLFHGKLPAIYSYAGTFLLILLTLPLIYHIIQRQVIPLTESNENGGFWRFIWIIPACNYLIFRLVINVNYFTIFPTSSSPRLLLLLIWPVVTTGVYYLELKLMHILTNKAELQAKMEEETTLLTLQEQRFEEQRDNLEHARRMRHDMRHNLLAIRGLLASGAWQEASSYSQDCIHWLRSGYPSQMEKSQPLSVKGTPNDGEQNAKS